MGIDEDIHYVLENTSDECVCFNYEICPNNYCEYEFIYNPSSYASETALTIRKSNVAKTYSSGCVAVKAPTITGGTLYYPGYLGTDNATPVGRAAKPSPDKLKFPLPPNDKVAVRVIGKYTDTKIAFRGFIYNNVIND